MPNDLGLQLTKIVLLLASLAVRRRATSSSTPVTHGVRRHTDPGAIHLAGRHRGMTTHVHLAVIGLRSMTPADMIVRHRRPLAKTPAIIAARIRPKSGGHGRKITRPTATIFHHLCHYRRQHQRNAHASAISVESESVTVTAHETEVETEVEIEGVEIEGVEIEKKGALGPHRTANLVPNLPLGRRLLHLLLIATLITRTCRISSTSFWVWNDPTRSRRRARP